MGDEVKGPAKQKDGTCHHREFITHDGIQSRSQRPEGYRSRKSNDISLLITDRQPEMVDSKKALTSYQSRLLKDRWKLTTHIPELSRFHQVPNKPGNRQRNAKKCGGNVSPTEKGLLAAYPRDV